MSSTLSRDGLLRGIMVFYSVQNFVDILQVFGPNRSYQHTLFPVLKFGRYGPYMSMKEICLKILFKLDGRMVKPSKDYLFRNI